MIPSGKAAVCQPFITNFGCCYRQALVARRCGRRKPGRPVRFELTEQTRQAVGDYIKAAGKKPGEFLFSGRGDHNRCMTTRQYARLVSRWVATIGPTRTFSARTLFDGPKRHSSTVEPATYVPCSCCWGIPRSRAPSGISASKSMTLSPLPNRSTSDLPGPSGITLPLPPRRCVATWSSESDERESCNNVLGL